MSIDRNTILLNLQDVRRRIQQALERSGRHGQSVRLVAVTKTVGVEEARTLLELGQEDLAENRVKEALAKQEALPRARWHLIGHLQTNKVKRALEFFDWIHSVDSLHLAREISKRAERLGREVDVLLEVNTSGEASKYGVTPEELPALAEAVSQLPRIRVRGLMTIAPIVERPEEARPYFVMLRELRDRLVEEGVVAELPHLSMGMTDDFEVAVEEGATMVRIGRAIFGERT